MIKRLLVAFSFIACASIAHAGFNPIRYVQISTNPVTQQSGSVSIQGANISTMTGTLLDQSTATHTGSHSFSGAMTVMSSITFVGTGSQPNIVQISTAAGISAIIISTMGVYTSSTQPSFLVTQAAATNGMTGNGLVVNSTWSTVARDTTGSFNSSTYTIPAAGMYEFGCTIAMANITTSNTSYGVGFAVNGNYATGGTYRRADSTGGTAYATWDQSMTAYAFFNKGDQIECVYFVSGGSTLNVNAGGDASRQFFWGHKTE